MKTIVTLTVWVTVAVTVLYLVLRAENGLLDQGPWTILGLGLIGLGLCREAHQRITAVRGPR